MAHSRDSCGGREGASSWVVAAGCSGLNTTFRWRMPRLPLVPSLHDYRPKGSRWSGEISVTRSRVGVQLVAGPQRSTGWGSGPRPADCVQLAGHHDRCSRAMVEAIRGGEEILLMGGLVGGQRWVDDGAGGDVPATAGGDPALDWPTVEGAELAVDAKTPGRQVLISPASVTYAESGPDLGGRLPTPPRPNTATGRFAGAPAPAGPAPSRCAKPFKSINRPLLFASQTVSKRPASASLPFSEIHETRYFIPEASVAVMSFTRALFHWV